ncbi:MAG: isoamylase early set domain-containing protein [Thermodesulfobacteriota bacterium]
MAKTSKKKEKVRNTEFSLLAPQAQSVFVAGHFNQWDPTTHPMKKDEEGIWKISIPLRPGQHEYRFFVDGEWQNDPDCCDFVENPFGTSNCLKIVG